MHTDQPPVRPTDLPTDRQNDARTHPSGVFEGGSLQLGHLGRHGRTEEECSPIPRKHAEHLVDLLLEVLSRTTYYTHTHTGGWDGSGGGGRGGMGEDGVKVGWGRIDRVG